MASLDPVVRSGLEDARPAILSPNPAATETPCGVEHSSVRQSTLGAEKLGDEASITPFLSDPGVQECCCPVECVHQLDLLVQAFIRLCNISSMISQSNENKP